LLLLVFVVLSLLAVSLYVYTTHLFHTVRMVPGVLLQYHDVVYALVGAVVIVVIVICVVVGVVICCIVVGVGVVVAGVVVIVVSVVVVVLNKIKIIFGYTMLYR